MDLQLLLHYAFHLLLALVSGVVTQNVILYEWIPLYISLSFACYQASRIFLKFKKYSAAPIYISFVPYCIFHLLVRNSFFLGIIWFYSVLGMALQIASQVNIGSEIIPFLTVLAFLIVYPAMSWRWENQ